MNKYLLIGLGNPGAEYKNTRHNVGFQLLDYFCHKMNATWSNDRFGWKAEFKIKGRLITCIKPDTYMNLSGKAVQFWLQKQNVELANALIILDDLNINFGTLRMRKNGSDGGHNGLKNIQETLQSKDYPRLRIGIGNNYQKGKQVHFVLGDWNEDEKKSLHLIFDACIEGMLTFVLAGADKGMNQLNGFTLDEKEKPKLS